MRAQIPLPPAPDEYSRSILQQVINAVKELQQESDSPKKQLLMVDVDDGSNQLIQVNAGVVEAVTP